ncbi:MAG: molybdopterin molybdenumtransferase MoeA, partial [Microvirga sp.]
MSLLPVEEALARVLAGIARPVAAESVAIAAALGRTLAVDVAARLTQPPFAASAMDGYAVWAADVAAVPARLTVI